MWNPREERIRFVAYSVGVIQERECVCSIVHTPAKKDKKRFCREYYYKQYYICTTSHPRPPRGIGKGDPRRLGHGKFLDATWGGETNLAVIPEYVHTVKFSHDCAGPFEGEGREGWTRHSHLLKYDLRLLISVLFLPPPTPPLFLTHTCI